MSSAPSSMIGQGESHLPFMEGVSFTFLGREYRQEAPSSRSQVSEVSMAQKESKLSREIMKALRLEGWFCFKVHGSETMMAGLPDIIVCAEGLFIGLETKRPGEAGATSRKQEYVHGLINAAGGHAQVIMNPHQAVEVVRAVLARARS